MNKSEFDRTGFAPKMTCSYDGAIRRIASVDLVERLIGLVHQEYEDVITWVRCENCSVFSGKQVKGQ